MQHRWWFYYAGTIIVLAMLIGGGTMQALWTDRIMQVLLIPSLFLGFGNMADSRWTPAAKLLAILAVLIFAIQFLPIGRAWPAGPDAVAHGIFLTTAASRTLESLLIFVPVLGFALFVSRMGDNDQERLIRFVIAGLLINLGVGTFQLSASAAAGEAGILPYKLDAGMFANRNHFSTLVFSSIPVLGYFYLSRTRRPAVFAGLLAITLLYLFAAGSRAGMALALVMASITTFMFSRLFKSELIRVLVVIALAGGGFTFALWQPDLFAIEGDARGAIFATTVEAVRDHWLTGTGIGSFVNVYPLYEDPEKVLNTYINHAHNDYLELALEAGVFSLLPVLAFLGLVAYGARRSAMAAAFSVSIAAIAAHSLVDYPLRTTAIGIMMAYLAAHVLCMFEPQAKRISTRRVTRPLE